jgi:hypothetical protein
MDTVSLALILLDLFVDEVDRRLDGFSRTSSSGAASA